MIKLKNYLFSLLGSALIIMNAHAQSNNAEANALMTVRDMQENALSKVTITNRTGQPVTVSGLYIVSYDINDCSSCFGGIVSGDNVGGVIASPVSFQANQTIPIGQNFLYNMIYNGIYFIKNTAGSSPCSLPGCSWPGDDPNVRGWCISVNAGSRNASYTYSNYTNGSSPPANLPPYSQASNSTPFDYKYALINPNTLGVGNACVGPVICDDKKLTCTVSTAQNESFQPY